MSLTATIYRTLEDGCDHGIVVEYEYTPGDPGCRYTRDGDPGWPPSPPEVEVVCARWDDPDDGADVELTEAEVGRVRELAESHGADERGADEWDAREDYRFRDDFYHHYAI